MREIKFRARAATAGPSHKKGDWLYGFCCQLVGPVKTIHFIMSGKADTSRPDFLQRYRIDIKTLGQFTGLKDKHGKEIYEGDVVRVVYGIPSGSSILEVVWRTGHNQGCEEKCQYGLSNKITGWWYKDHSHGHDSPMFVNDDFEVVGNTHENKDLLGE